MIEEASRLAVEGVSQYELTRAVNRFESNYTFSNINFLAKAQAMAQCEMNNEDINGIVARYRAVSVKDISRVAREIIDPQRRCTLIYSPEW